MAGSRVLGMAGKMALREVEQRVMRKGVVRVEQWVVKMDGRWASPTAAKSADEMDERRVATTVEMWVGQLG